MDSLRPWCKLSDMLVLRIKWSLQVQEHGADNWTRPNMNTPPLLPEDVIDAALTKAVSTLGLAGLAQDQAAGLAAVFGFWSQQEVVSESSMKRHEACRDTWTETHLVGLLIQIQPSDHSSISWK
ncbi:hypothetical protein EYF80_002525 [Liparis tanakae]|uniref:Uncharacterized protein n=1 Tax=Liparis tanakae TaxID=230148 RepID=A0A4Z2JBY3_9TELE|nr:hypothetical protein EYF80_002525 [Liparis tanakae]